MSSGGNHVSDETITAAGGRIEDTSSINFAESIGENRSTAINFLDPATSFQTTSSAVYGIFTRTLNSSKFVRAEFACADERFDAESIELISFEEPTLHPAIAIDVKIEQITLVVGRDSISQLYSQLRQKCNCARSHALQSCFVSYTIINCTLALIRL